ncbi:hypothetical protein PIB30_058634, partial [Stylosanthes scabra]|nr:hypothetical protein [Stylosanthes scabra]
MSQLRNLIAKILTQDIMGTNLMNCVILIVIKKKSRSRKQVGLKGTREPHGVR